MRLSIALVPLVALACLVALAGCDSEAVVSDLDLVEFRGADAAIDGEVGGLASHNLTHAEASRLVAVTIRLDLRGDDGAVRTAQIVIPMINGLLAARTYALPSRASADANRWVSDTFGAGADQVTATGGAVTVTEVRRSADSAEIVGSVEIAFDTGTLTGAFRAVESHTRMSGCDQAEAGCADYSASRSSSSVQPSNTNVPSGARSASPRIQATGQPAPLPPTTSEWYESPT